MWILRILLIAIVMLLSCDETTEHLVKPVIAGNAMCSGGFHSESQPGSSDHHWKVECYYSSDTAIDKEVSFAIGINPSVFGPYLKKLLIPPDKHGFC